LQLLSEAATLDESMAHAKLAEHQGILRQLGQWHHQAQHHKEPQQEAVDPRCLVCLETDQQLVHIRPHVNNHQHVCGPFPICLPCGRTLCEKASGQLACPVCKIQLGPLQRALQEGRDAFKREGCKKRRTSIKDYMDPKRIDVTGVDSDEEKDSVSQGDVMTVGQYENLGIKKQVNATSPGVGDVVQAPQLLADGCLGSVATLRVEEIMDHGYRVSLVDFAAAKVQKRRDGWIVLQPRREQATKWFGYSKYGDLAEANARACKDEWDKTDSHALLVEEGKYESQSSMPLYSLGKAPKRPQEYIRYRCTRKRAPPLQDPGPRTPGYNPKDDVPEQIKRKAAPPCDDALVDHPREKRHFKIWRGARSAGDLDPAIKDEIRWLCRARLAEVFEGAGSDGVAGKHGIRVGAKRAKLAQMDEDVGAMLPLLYGGSQASWESAAGA